MPENVPTSTSNVDPTITGESSSTHTSKDANEKTVDTKLMKELTFIDKKSDANSDATESADDGETSKSTNDSKVEKSESKCDVIDDKQKDDSSDGTSKPQLNEENSDDNLIDIEDPDDYLLYLETILLKIHSRFYTHYDETKKVTSFLL